MKEELKTIREQMRILCIAELRRIVNNNRLPLRRLLEWSTSESVVRKNAREGEVVVHCPKLNVWCAIDKSDDKR